jgi:general secretion pathway protein B
LSYILDALKKAAEQRGATATALLRSPAPLARGVRLGRLPWMVAGGLLLLNLAGLIYLLRPTHVAPAPPLPPPRTVALIQPIVPPPPPAPTQVIEAGPPRPAAPVTSPAAPAKTAAVKPTLERASPPRSTPAPDPRSTVTVPVIPSAPARSETSSKLKLEVLSYSEVPAQRLVFINGRRYREGETIDGGPKVEEIREDGVVLSEGGQRFTLR